MNTKKLVKIIQLVVERELKRQLPPLVKVGVLRELKEQKVVSKPIIKENITVEKPIDPFSLANSMLDEVQNEPKVKIEKPLKKLSKNKVLNEILNKTKPFVRNPLVEAADSGYIPPGQTEPVEVDDRTISFDKNIAGGGLEGMKAQMAAKMGYGGYTLNTGDISKPGLNVKTGLAGLDKILNRDNSALVAKFKTRK